MAGCPRGDGRQRGASDGERGSATIWTVALAGVLALLGAASVLMGAAVVARHRAGAAADLAALAVAVRAVRGDPAACGTGTSIATVNGAQLVGCSVGAGSVVTVEVSVPVRLGPLGLLAATGRARAGPVPWGGAP
ncbi:Rv3654c family TadE-like protein [Klenkia sp. LSe6-5]|uniref:Rv3654c family TadE-like protein n=1 Tax=Klenkia sesuvii TaxID=3103137 RepID=A0ABU8DUS9_9ACTN